MSARLTVNPVPMLHVLEATLLSAASTRAQFNFKELAEEVGLILLRIVIKTP